jgi:hypothetical protein
VSEVVAGKTDHRGRLPNLVAGVLLTLIFGGAFVIALDMEGNAAIFPLGVGGLGVVLGATFLIRSLRRPPAVDAGSPPNVGDDDEDTDEDLQYAFETASSREWAVALAYIAAFFAALYVLGLYLAAPLFTVIYLRHQAKASWILTIGYATVLFAVLYGAFELVLHLPVPPGLFSD